VTVQGTAIVTFDASLIDTNFTMCSSDPDVRIVIEVMGGEVYR